MLIKQSLQDWINILSAAREDEDITLSPSEVLRLVYDLQQAQRGLQMQSHVMRHFARVNGVLRARAK